MQNRVQKGSFLRFQHLVFSLGLVLIVSVVAFRDFIFGKAYYIFLDIGSDTIDAYWPILYSISTAVSEGTFSWWIPEYGPGASIFSLSALFWDPFNLILFYLGNDKILPLLSYIAICKILIASLFFYLYLIKLRLSPITCIVGSVLFSFNGYMILWGQHYSFASAIVLVTLMMYTFERWLQSGYWKAFVLTTTLFIIQNYYIWYMFTIFLMIYIVYRYILFRGYDFKGIVCFAIKTGLLYLLAIGISSIVFLPTMEAFDQSPRSSLLWCPIFELNSISYYVSLILRFFSNDSLGTGSHFFGDINYYEAPIVYCGVITLILLPQLFVVSPDRERRIYTVFTGVFVAMLLLPFFSLVMSGFCKLSSYRWTFIFILYMLYASLHAFDKIVKTSQFDIPVFFKTILLGIIISGGALYTGSVQLNWTQGQVVTVLSTVGVSILLMILYGSMLIGATKSSKPYVFYFLILSLVCTEAAYFTHRTLIEKRGIGKQSTMIRLNHLYFDGTEKAIEWLYQHDTGYFRTEKGYISRYLNDSLIQNYRGLRSYSSVTNSSYLDFVYAFGFRRHGTRVNLTGIENNFSLLSFTGVKYFIQQSGNIIPYGFNTIKEIGGFSVSENQFAVPFGAVYNKYIVTSDFLQLSLSERELLLPLAAIIEDDLNATHPFFNTKNPNYSLERITLPITVSLTEEVDLIIPHQNKSQTNGNEISIPCKINARTGIISLNLRLSPLTQEPLLIYWRQNGGQVSKENSLLLKTIKGRTNYRITLDVDNTINEIVIKAVLNHKSVISLEKISYSIISPSIYADNVTHLQKKRLELTLFTDSSFQGDITLAAPGIMFFSIPFDRGWHASVNGKQQSLVKTSLGFSGLLLPTGTHNIKLSYRPDSFIVGTIGSGVSLLIFLILAVRGKKGRSCFFYKKSVA
jgi:uncharacterized membrane protein YfhO